MVELVKHIRWIHATLVVVSVGLLLAISNTSSPLDEARQELKSILSIKIWLKPGWLERSTLEQLGLSPPKLLPTSISFTAQNTLNPYSSMHASFPQLIKTSNNNIDQVNNLEKIQQFFRYWDSLLDPIEIEVFDGPDYQARRQSATSRYIANEAVIQPIINPYSDPGTWVIPHEEYISDVEVEFLFDNRPTTHAAVITFDKVGEGGMERMISGQTRAFFEAFDPSDRPFFLRESIKIAESEYEIFDPTGFELSFRSYWRTEKILPQHRVLGEFPSVLGGDANRSFPALTKLVNGLSDSEIKEDLGFEFLDRLLNFLAGELKAAETFSLFGLALPVNLILFWAVPLIVVIQMYLSLYLYRFVQILNKNAQPFELVWIGVLDHIIARLMTWTTVCFLPACVSLIFVWRLATSTTGTWAFAVVGISILGLWASYSSGRSLWQITKMAAAKN